MFEVLFLGTFNVCLQPSNGLEIIMVKRFQEKSTKLNPHNPKYQNSQLIAATDALKSFITSQLLISQHFQGF